MNDQPDQPDQPDPPADSLADTPAEALADSPPTAQGDFVPVKPPEAWPTVVGVLAIIFGAMGTLQNACGAAGMVAVKAVGAAGELIPEGDAEDLEAQLAASFPFPVLQAAQMFVEFVLSIVLLVGGIMLLMRKRSSAKVLTTFAWLDLLSNTYIAVLGYFVFRAAMRAAAENPDMDQLPAGFQGMMGAIGPVTVVVGWLLTAIWPIFLIWWFRRAKVREAVAAWG